MQLCHKYNTDDEQTEKRHRKKKVSLALYKEIQNQKRLKKECFLQYTNVLSAIKIAPLIEWLMHSL